MKPPFSPLLTTAMAPPIMEVQRWVRETELPEGLELINLSQAAPVGAPPEALRAHLADAILSNEAAHFYGPVLGNPDLRAEIAAQWSAAYGADIRLPQVAITAGCNQAFCTAIATACEPGDEVILPFPWYFNHKMWLDMAGVTTVPVACNDRMLPDPSDVRRKITPRTRAIVLVTPNNPSGAEYPGDLVLDFFELAVETNQALIVDETYRDFHGEDGPPHPVFQQPGWERTLVHLYSFSKVFRLTGHRTGAMIASTERLVMAEKFLDTIAISAPQTGQIAALFGLHNLGDWVADERTEILARRAHLIDLFARDLPNWKVHGAGGYFAWVTPPFDLPAAELARRLLAERALLVLPGSMFMPMGTQTGALRIAFANADREGLTEMTRRLASFQP
jgi:aspartate/methionine/tyrosine aminotransferase